jgi:hypothetical protein
LTDVLRSTESYKIFLQQQSSAENLAMNKMESEVKHCVANRVAYKKDTTTSRPNVLAPSLQLTAERNTELKIIVLVKSRNAVLGGFRWQTKKCTA